MPAEMKNVISGSGRSFCIFEGKLMVLKMAKEITGWGIAIVFSIAILNLFTFCFYHPVHELSRSGGASPGLMVPYQWGLYGTEGWGIQTIDSNGYPNPDLPLEEEYYCITGMSHTEGFHSMKGERYSDILNQKSGYHDSLKFYNIAHSGYEFDQIARHFKGIVEEFPDMEGIIIEIDSTNYSVERLNNALDQIGYAEENDSIEALLAKLSVKDRSVITFKNYFPFFRLLSMQLETYRKSCSEKEMQNVSDPEISLNINEYKKSLDKVFTCMRSEYQGRILIVYHPSTTLNPDGLLSVSHSKTDDIFEAECARYKIDFINLGPDFEKAFYDDNHAVYGFWNTTLMYGHINKYCHQIIADKIYDYLYHG